MKVQHLHLVTEQFVSCKSKNLKFWGCHSHSGIKENYTKSVPLMFDKIILKIFAPYSVVTRYQVTVVTQYGLLGIIPYKVPCTILDYYLAILG